MSAQSRHFPGSFPRKRESRLVGERSRGNRSSGFPLPRGRTAEQAADPYGGPKALMVVIVLALAFAMAHASPTTAQTIDLSGKTVTLAIATPPGGGYDL